MSEDPVKLSIYLSIEGGDTNELDDLTFQLKKQMRELSLEVEQVSGGPAPDGTKAPDLTAFGQSHSSHRLSLLFLSY